MKAIVENKVKDFSRETADQFVFIINRILKANNETELKSFIQDAKKSDYLINWFFYSGSNHVAVHQAINSKPEKERILFVEF